MTPSKILITLSGEILSGEIFHCSKNLSLSPEEKFHPIKMKVSFVEVQMNLGGKKVIWKNFDYLTERNIVGRNFRRANTFARQSFAR